MAFNFDENILSDLHKDARGFRPRSEYFWQSWNDSTDAGKQSIWDGLCEELRLNEEARELGQKLDAICYEAEVQKFIDMGAGNRETALRWMLESDGEMHHQQDVESFLYNRGVLFCENAKALLAELVAVVTYTEPDWA